MKIVVTIDDIAFQGILMLVSAGEGSASDIAIASGTPLPEHHGRLVDLDNIKEQLERYGRKSVYYQLPYSPTIIEAEGSDTK